MARPGNAPRAGIVGRYLIAHEIASGGMATVHLGKLCGPAGFAPIVAIKALHAHYAKDPEFARMFQDEARLAGRIRHPNIVPVLDVYAEESELFLVLEYIHGESLSRLVAATRRQGSSIALPIVSAIMCDVLRGLHAAHEAKGERGEPLDIVHRDVSPQNILVGVDGSARVLDFGVAKAAGRVTTTRDGQVKGKFAYMAPEQLRGGEVNRQADVYAAAVVLWEILTCQRLFSAENEGNTVEKVLFAQVPPPSTARGDVPPALDAVVMRGLSRARSERFSTAKEMAIALEAAVPPARASEVGEWVEGRAVDALEKRARLVAEVEATPVPTTTPAVPEAILAPPAASSEVASASAAPVLLEEGTTSGQSVPDAPTREPASSQKPRATGRVVLVASASALSVVAVGLLFFIRAQSVAPSALPSQEVTSAGTPAVAAPSVSPVESVAQTTEPPPVAIADAASPARPKPLATPVGTVRRPAAGTPPAARPPPAPSSTSRCARRNADGLITFDAECLRGAQRGP